MFTIIFRSSIYCLLLFLVNILNIKVSIEWLNFPQHLLHVHYEKYKILYEDFSKDFEHVNLRASFLYLPVSPVAFLKSVSKAILSSQPLIF